MQSLSPEVANFDPHLALSGGSDGLEAYRNIIKGAPNHLVAGGHIVFEIGYDQGVSVSALLSAAGLHEVSTHKDLAGHDRMVKAVWQG
jgi:release factor glutamine methyltransferase